MDILQEYTPYILQLYQHLRPTMQHMTTLLHTLLSTASRTLTPLLLPLLNRLALFASESPAVVTLVLLGALLVLSLKVLNLARRLVVFWTRIVFWVALYGALAVGAWALWERGLVRSWEDLGAWGAELVDVWWREYRRWDGFQKSGGGGAGQGWGAAGRGYGVRGGNAGTAWR